MGKISLWWQKLASCAGWHHEPTSVQTCVAIKSLTMGKKPSRTTLSWSKIMLNPHSSDHLGFPGKPGCGSQGLAIQRAGYYPHRTHQEPDGGPYPFHGLSTDYGCTMLCGSAAGLCCPEACLPSNFVDFVFKNEFQFQHKDICRFRPLDVIGLFIPLERSSNWEWTITVKIKFKCNQWTTKKRFVIGF